MVSGNTVLHTKWPRMYNENTNVNKELLFWVDAVICGSNYHQTYFCVAWMAHKRSTVNCKNPGALFRFVYIIWDWSVHLGCDQIIQSNVREMRDRLLKQPLNPQLNLKHPIFSQNWQKIKRRPLSLCFLWHVCSCLLIEYEREQNSIGNKICLFCNHAKDAANKFITGIRSHKGFRGSRRIFEEENK